MQGRPSLGRSRARGANFIFASWSTRSCEDVCTSNRVHDAPATSLPSPHRAAHSASYRAAKTFHSARLAQSFPQVRLLRNLEFGFSAGPACAQYSRRVRQGSPLATTRGTHPARSSPKPLLAQVKKASQLAHATLPLHCSRASRAQGVRSPRNAVPARTRMVERHERGLRRAVSLGLGRARGLEKDIIYYELPVYGTSTYSEGTIRYTVNVYMVVDTACVHQNTGTWKHGNEVTGDWEGRHGLDEQRTGTDGGRWESDKSLRVGKNSGHRDVQSDDAKAWDGVKAAKCTGDGGGFRYQPDDGSRDGILGEVVCMGRTRSKGIQWECCGQRITIETVMGCKRDIREMTVTQQAYGAEG